MTEFHLYLYGPARGPIETSFEESEARLRDLPSLYFEPDGSFSWVRRSGQEQVFGMVYDAAGRIQYCDLQGHCSLETWRLLRQAITGGVQHELELLLLPGGELQDLQTFERRWLQK